MFSGTVTGRLDSTNDSFQTHCLQLAWKPCVRLACKAPGAFGKDTYSSLDSMSYKFL